MRGATDNSIEGATQPVRKLLQGSLGGSGGFRDPFLVSGAVSMSSILCIQTKVSRHGSGIAQGLAAAARDGTGVLVRTLGTRSVLAASQE